MHADPGDPLVAFAEYAADHFWIASHLMQLAGIGLMVAALLILAEQMEAACGRRWSRIASGSAIASFAMAAVLQAIDGIALKVTVDAWAAAPAPQKDMAFYAAFAVRQIELTAVIYGLGQRLDERYPKWMSALALAGGLATMAAGVVIAYTGFSELAMTVNMPANLALLVWMAGVGKIMWRPAGINRGLA
jgi:hypothetical protein